MKLSKFFIFIFIVSISLFAFYGISRTFATEDCSGAKVGDLFVCKISATDAESNNITLIVEELPRGLKVMRGSELDQLTSYNSIASSLDLSCMPGFHASTTVCVSDIADCDASIDNATTTAKYWDSTSEWGSCKVVKCDVGYNVSVDRSRCEPLCGDNDIQAMYGYKEECDGEDLGGQTCRTMGKWGMGLSCSTSCDFDTSECLDSEPSDNRTFEYSDRPVFIVPEHVYEIQVEIWGAGGGGGGSGSADSNNNSYDCSGAGGGGGSGYYRIQNLSVTPGATSSVIVGQGGLGGGRGEYNGSIDGTDGGDSSFDNISVSGGKGGKGGKGSRSGEPGRQAQGGAGGDGHKKGEDGETGGCNFSGESEVPGSQGGKGGESNMNGGNGADGVYSHGNGINAYEGEGGQDGKVIVCWGNGC